MNIIISEIEAIAKVNPHSIVLTGVSGKLDESLDGKHVFINKKGAVTNEGGPVIGDLYKLRFNIAGEFETIQKMAYIGYANEYKRYIFTKKP